MSSGRGEDGRWRDTSARRLLRHQQATALVVSIDPSRVSWRDGDMKSGCVILRHPVFPAEATPPFLAIITIISGFCAGT